MIAYSSEQIRSPNNALFHYYYFNKLVLYPSEDEKLLFPTENKTDFNRWARFPLFVLRPFPCDATLIHLRNGKEFPLRTYFRVYEMPVSGPCVILSPNVVNSSVFLWTDDALVHSLTIFYVTGRFTKKLILPDNSLKKIRLRSWEKWTPPALSYLMSRHV